MQTVNLLNYSNNFKPQSIQYRKNSNNAYYSQYVSFEGRKHNQHMDTAVYLFSLIVAGSMFYYTFENMLHAPQKKEPRIIIENFNENQISTNVCWGKNTRVLASAGQNVKTMTSYYSYSRYLIDKLKQKDVNTLEQANNILSKDGYIIHDSEKNVFYEFWPLETFGPELNIFNKNDKGKERFVLIFSQDGDDKSPVFNNLKNDFNNNLKEIYDITDDNIVKISAKNKLDFKRGISAIKNKLNNIKNKADVELLIVYFGHGVAGAKFLDTDKIEGAMEGFILKDLKEEEVKQIFKENFEDIKTLFMLQTCQSGAWIADKGKKAVENSEEFVRVYEQSKNKLACSLVNNGKKAIKILNRLV